MIRASMIECLIQKKITLHHYIKNVFLHVGAVFVLKNIWNGGLSDEICNFFFQVRINLPSSLNIFNALLYEIMHFSLATYKCKPSVRFDSSAIADITYAYFCATLSKCYEISIIEKYILIVT